MLQKINPLVMTRTVDFHLNNLTNLIKNYFTKIIY